jgi:hypothetical protein
LIGELADDGRGTFEPVAQRLQSATVGAREFTVHEPPFAGGEPSVGRGGVVRGAAAAVS